jgi:hypothetical protein
MSSTNQIKVLLSQKTGHNLLPKGEGHASVIAAPEFRVLAKYENKFIAQHCK